MRGEAVTCHVLCTARGARICEDGELSKLKALVNGLQEAQSNAVAGDYDASRQTLAAALIDLDIAAAMARSKARRS